jgi:Zn-dependent peptidase ImmA (M78 family)
LFALPDYQYGYPAYEHGYRLAAETRKRLNIDPSEPISGLRELIEARLGIPVVQQELGQTFAGATLSNGDVRGIVVNLLGMNENVWVRRMTLCHELGHLLWDPNNRLNKLTVDRYAEIENPYGAGGQRPRDPVEIRANAFAISFLAPPSAVENAVDKLGANDAVAYLMENYGIGSTAARAHIENVVHIRPNVQVRDLPNPSDEWNARESYAVDFFPVHGTPYSRTGKFATLVARAAIKGLISLDSAASLLAATPAAVEQQLSTLAELHA